MLRLSHTHTPYKRSIRHIYSNKRMLVRCGGIPFNRRQLLWISTASSIESPSSTSSQSIPIEIVTNPKTAMAVKHALLLFQMLAETLPDILDNPTLYRGVYDPLDVQHVQHLVSAYQDLILKVPHIGGCTHC